MLKKSFFLMLMFAVAASTGVAADDADDADSGRLERPRVGRAAADLPERHSTAVDGDPVFARANGWTYSAWAYRSDGEYSIAISFRDVYNGWSDPVYLGLGDGLDQVDPALAADDRGNLYLAYSVPQAGEIWMTAKWTARDSWFAPQKISMGQDVGGTPAVGIVGDSVVLAFRSELSGVRIFDWPELPDTPQGFDTEGIQEGPDGFPLTGWTPGESGSGHQDIIDDRDDNTTSDNDAGGNNGSHARTNGRTGR